MLKILLTEKEILEQVSQERVMEYYLGITPSSELVCSPFRADKKPGCSFWKNPQTSVLYFKDWAWNKSWTCVQVVMQKYNIPYYRAISKLNLDLPRLLEGYNKDYELPPQEAKNIQVVVKHNFEKHEEDYWKKYGISKETREHYHCKPVKEVYINKSLVWKATKSNPIFSYYFPESDKLKVYRPLNKDKKYKWISSCKATDIVGYDLYVKGRPKGQTLIITSSVKDAMVLNQLGFPAIAPIAEGVMIRAEIMEKLSRYYKYIFVFMDSDTTGHRVNLEYKNNYPYVMPISIPLSLKSKDISDYRSTTNLKKTYKLIKKLLKEALIPRESQIPF